MVHGCIFLGPAVRGNPFDLGEDGNIHGRQVAIGTVGELVDAGARGARGEVLPMSSVLLT